VVSLPAAGFEERLAELPLGLGGSETRPQTFLKSLRSTPHTLRGIRNRRNETPAGYWSEPHTGWP
jgi:hypothetical protein